MKRKLITGLVIGLLVFGVQMSFVVDSYPGYHDNADCSLCHNYPATAYPNNDTFDNYNLNVDGLLDDGLWDEHGTDGRRTMIPVGSTSGFPRSRMMLTMYFGQNSTHFFMVVNWGDNTLTGTDSVYGADSDKLAIIFNINNSPDEFDSGYTQGSYGMDLAPDGDTDFLLWTPAASETGQELYQNDYQPKAIDSHLYDMHIDEGTTSRVADATNDWSYAAVHGNVSHHNEHNYQLELARPLVTDDAKDVQFSEQKYYQFAIAYFNDTSGSGHWISPPYEVYVHGPNAPAPNVVTTTVEGEPADPVTTTVVSTQVESEGKEPLAFLPVVLALFALPVIVLLRRK